MRFLYILFIFSIAALLLGCNNASSVLSKAREAGIPSLRKDLEKLATSNESASHDIPQASWPASVRRMKPIAVEHHNEGLLLVYKKSERNQEGLLVMLDVNKDPGSGGSGVSYESLRDGLFWCREKIRTPQMKR
ncbi:MAG: hypothetical protein H0X66_02020 [Verrucomicrobia bacterium]|nr:hypothetical protein [Verrucomicrobiota bacterium]